MHLPSLLTAASAYWRWRQNYVLLIMLLLFWVLNKCCLIQNAPELSDHIIENLKIQIFLGSMPQPRFPSLGRACEPVMESQPSPPPHPKISYYVYVADHDFIIH